MAQLFLCLQIFIYSDILLTQADLYHTTPNNTCQKILLVNHNFIHKYLTTDDSVSFDCTQCATLGHNNVQNYILDKSDNQDCLACTQRWTQFSSITNQVSKTPPLYTKMLKVHSHDNSVVQDCLPCTLRWTEFSSITSQVSQIASLAHQDVQISFS